MNGNNKIISIKDPLFLPHSGCDLELSLAAGTALVLIGENGIGKSTLLTRIQNQLAHSQRVVVEQKTPNFFFDRKVRLLKNFFLQGELPGFNKENFNSLWKNFGLNGKEDRLLSQLSGGEAQALKLRLSLCKDVSFYLLDEPSQFLDNERKEYLAIFLESLISQNKSLLLTEHNRDWVPKSWRVQKLKMANQTLVEDV